MSDALPSERRIVRAGVVCLGIAAVVALVCCALPGYRITEVDSTDCMNRAMDFGGHGGGRDTPCVRTERDLGTERAGDPVIALVVFLMMSPALAVWRRGRAFVTAGWAGAIWFAGVIYVFIAIASYDGGDAGCSGVYQVREPLLPSIILGWCGVALFFGPMLLAGVAAIARVVERRRLARDRLPTATLRSP